MNKQNLVPAKWWKPVGNNKILCTLCPRYCKIGEGQPGFCFIRQNHNGKLYSIGYGKPTGFAIDPIEKKPLNHFIPGTQILSFGTAGCNLGCRFCQNWSISKAKLDDLNSVGASPEDVVRLAQYHKVPSIAFTYNDPTIFGEYVIDISKIAREVGIKTVMVTAGYVDKEARKDIYQYIDAANVDLKAFSERFYFKLTFSHLNDILDTLVWLKKETGVWVEITTLLIPDENDSPDEIKKESDWILDNLGDNVPVHFTAFHPDFKMKNKLQTPIEAVKKAREISASAGIKYVYTGNIHDPEGQTTYCSGCKTPLIRRNWHSITSNKIRNGKCPHCGEQIAGVFN